jgi:hypothetical protein
MWDVEWHLWHTQWSILSNNTSHLHFRLPLMFYFRHSLTAGSRSFCVTLWASGATDCWYFSPLCFCPAISKNMVGQKNHGPNLNGHFTYSKKPFKHPKRGLNSQWNRRGFEKHLQCISFKLACWSTWVIPFHDRRGIIFLITSLLSSWKMVTCDRKMEHRHPSYTLSHMLPHQQSWINNYS